MSALPMSAELALWFTAWVTGSESLDDARDAIVGADTAHDLVGLPGEDTAVPLILALGKLRATGTTGAGIALPIPGDPLGLAGPAGFNTAALEAGEGVVLEGADIGLVPQRAGQGVVWSYYTATSRRQVPDPAEADTTLRQAVLTASDRLADLDVARWCPEAADDLMGLRRIVDLHLPRGLAPRALRLMSVSTRCRKIVHLALGYDGGAISSFEVDQRRAALSPLDHAARRGMVAACAFPWER